MSLDASKDGGSGPILSGLIQFNEILQWICGPGYDTMAVSYPGS